MRCGAVGVLCVLTTTCVFQCQALNLPLIQAVKDYFNPTTTAATLTLAEYEAEPASSFSNREGKEEVEVWSTTRVPTDYEDSTTAAREYEDSTTGARDHDVPSPSYNSTKERPYPPQNFPTTSPPGVREVYQGTTNQMTAPRPSLGPGDQQLPYEQTNDNDIPYDQETRTTVRTSLGGENYNQMNTESTTNYDSFVSDDEKCTNLGNSDQTNINQEEPRRNVSEQPKVQTPPTIRGSSNKSQDENFIFPDDPRVVEAEGPRNATVPVGGGRTIIKAPAKACGKGRQMDASGNCRTVARK